eukprot:1422686-Amphidinium_carterae.1
MSMRAAWLHQFRKARCPQLSEVLHNHVDTNGSPAYEDKDEKVFKLDESVHFARHVMVSCGVSWAGSLPPFFVESRCGNQYRRRCDSVTNTTCCQAPVVKLPWAQPFCPSRTMHFPPTDQQPH